MTLIRKPPAAKIEYDLTGPAGNAFAVLGNASEWARQLGWSKTEIDALMAKATSGNYKHLVETINEAFDEIVDFILPDNWSTYE